MISNNIFKVSNFSKSNIGTNFVKLTTPATTFAASGYLEWDPTSTYLGFCHGSTPYINIYKRTGDTFTNITIASLPPNATTNCSWDPTSTYLAVSSQAAPYLVIYKRSGDTFTKLSNPATLPGAVSNSCSFDSTGTYLAVAQNSSPAGCIIYKRSGDTFTTIPGAISTAGQTIIRDVAWDPTGTYLGVLGPTAPTNFVFKRVGDTFTKITLSGGTTGLAQGISWDSTGKYIFVLNSTGLPRNETYRNNYNDTFTLITSPVITANGSAVKCSPSGHVFYATQDPPYYYRFKINYDTNTFTSVTSPSTVPGQITGMAVSNDSKYYAYVFGGSPNLYIFKLV